MILRPSATERWGNCAFSFGAEAHYPEDEGDEARLGTAAHYVATEGAQGRTVVAGTTAPNGVIIDDDMVRHAGLFIREVQAAREGASNQRTEGTETPVTMHAHIHTQCEGTPDWFLIDYGRRVVHVKDYKYGHRPHDPVRHLQLCAYFAGVVEGSGLTRAEVDDKWTVVLTIVQPRSYVPEGPVRTWSVPAPVVWGVVTGLSASALRATGPNPPAVTGDHCRDCTARLDCRAYTATCGVAMDFAGQSTLGNQGPDVQGDELLRVQWALKRLKARETALTTQLEASLRGGKPVRGWMLEPTKGNRKWTKPPGEVQALGDMMGVNLRTSDLLTPTQAIEAGIDETVIRAYSERPTGHKLAPVNAKSAARAFGGK